MPKFEVKVARTRIESVVITVDASTPEAAEVLALGAAAQVSDDQWSLYDTSAEAVDTFELAS